MAGSPSRTLKLTYLGDASGLSKSTQKAGNDVTSLGQRVGKVGKAIAVGLLAVGAAGIAMGKKLFDAFEQVSTANARIEAVVTSMGNFEGQITEVTQKLVEQANATARLTGMDRTLIKESQALLLTFDSVNKTASESGGVFDRATQAAVDLAAAGFGSVTTNATQLGKALEDPIRGLSALGRSGITFTEEQKELIKSLVESNNTLAAQGIILSAIERQVGGVAEATANSSDRMRQSFGILTEQIATALAPAFAFLAEKAIAFIDDAMVWWEANGDDVIQKFRDFGTATKDLFTNMRDFTGLVVAELRANGSLARLQIKFNDLKLQADDTRAAFDSFFDSFTGADTEAKASTFARIIEIGYLKPLQGIIDRVDKALQLLEKFFGLAERVKGIIDEVTAGERGSLGDLGFAPAGALPGSVTGMNSSGAGQRTTGNVIVNVSGAIDPEGTARVIRRVLDGQIRRTGTQSSGTQLLV